MLNILKTLILSTGLAALVCAAPLPVHPASHDPCSTLAALNVTAITIDHVSSCYKSIEFNPTIAKDTLDTLYTIYNDFYVFRDSALTPKLPLPFVSPPVDILAGLEEIYKKRYSIDYDFHLDINLLINRLNDAHCTYSPNCYNSYIFQQPIGLYAPVENGVQTFRVLLDGTNQGLEDCQVLEIDATSPAIYLQAWADKYTGYSKDAGVRLNKALPSRMYFPQTQTWDWDTGLFASSSYLPDSSFVTYNLQCGPQGPGNGKPFDVQGKWVVGPIVDMPAFTDKASYLKNVCLVSPPTSTGTHGSSASVMDPRNQAPRVESDALTLHRNEMHLKRFTEKQELLKKRQEAGQSTPSRDFPDAIFVDGNNTAVYQLKSKPNVGILVLPTMEVDPSTEVPAVQSYLHKLAKLGVTNVIIDTSKNGGGSVDFAAYIVDLFFPTHSKRKTSHLSRLKVSAAATALTNANLANTSIPTYYNPEMLADPTTDLPLTINPFLTPVQMTINGVTAEYTHKYYLDYDLTPLNQSETYPWSGDASKITILTDGQCGSACGMMSDFFMGYGVKAVAVGGYYRRELSMFSFPGAAVLKIDDLESAFSVLGVPLNFEPLPYQNWVQFGVVEVYRDNDETPLEYNPVRYPAAYRLDYTNATALHHDQLWGAVAQTAWSI
ncbi:hypothetical protein BGZ49_003966 [Haplosporangium sp. Z 27]|nr:hypothetical protein BGZ49_003966 [Haplosporangium sp. Z 27]